MAKASDFHRNLAEKVFERMTSAGIVSFDEDIFARNLFVLLRRENAFDGRDYHKRVVKPLVEKMFTNLSASWEKPFALAHT